MLKLLIQDDEGRKTLVPFSREEITIGRESGNTIRLTERNVSRRHARLFRHSTQIFIEDLKSHNGIHINGRRISGQAVVRKGDTIAIGDYDIVLEGNVSTPPLPATSKTPRSSPPPPPAEPCAAPAAAEFAPPPLATPISARETLDLANEAPLLGPPPDDASTPPLSARPTLELSEQQRPTLRLPDLHSLPDAKAPRLVALNLELRGREFVCRKTECSIGRTVENDIALKHPSVAPVHCHLERDDCEHWFLALYPQHPVRVNGETYRQFALEHGDIISLGKQELQFFLPETPLPSPRGLKKNPPKFLPFAIGLFLSFLVVLAFLFLYWNTGALHEASSPSVRSLAHQFLPLPDVLVEKVLPPPAPPDVQPTPAPTPAPSEPAPPPAASLNPAQLLSAPPNNTPNDNGHASAAALLPSTQTPEPPAPAKLALEKPPPPRPPPAKPPPPRPPVKPPAPGPPKLAQAPPPAPKPAPAPAPPPPTSLLGAAPVDTPSSPLNDVDLFWEDVFLLQRKAEHEFTLAAKRVTLSTLYNKLSGCGSPRCAFERAHTSLMLARLDHANARTRFPGEFEAYLSMKDAGKEGRERKDKACKELLRYYNTAGNTPADKAKVQSISQVCTK